MHRHGDPSIVATNDNCLLEVELVWCCSGACWRGTSSPGPLWLKEGRAQRMLMWVSGAGDAQYPPQDTLGGKACVPSQYLYIVSSLTTFTIEFDVPLRAKPTRCAWFSTCVHQSTLFVDIAFDNARCTLPVAPQNWLALTQECCRGWAAISSHDWSTALAPSTSPPTFHTRATYIDESHV
jgi:hypothetical protein